MLNRILDVCPGCRFPKRISGFVFIANDTISLANHISIEKQRCKICRHLPDYIIPNYDKKNARIIYRNFDKSEEYFEKVKKFLKSKGFKILGIGDKI